MPKARYSERKMMQGGGKSKCVYVVHICVISDNIGNSLWKDLENGKQDLQSQCRYSLFFFFTSHSSSVERQGARHTRVLRSCCPGACFSVYAGTVSLCPSWCFMCRSSLDLLNSHLRYSSMPSVPFIFLFIRLIFFYPPFMCTPCTCSPLLD